MARDSFTSNGKTNLSWEIERYFFYLLRIIGYQSFIKDCLTLKSLEQTVVTIVPNWWESLPIAQRLGKKMAFFIAYIQHASFRELNVKLSIDLRGHLTFPVDNSRSTFPANGERPWVTWPKLEVTRVWGFRLAFWTSRGFNLSYFTQSLAYCL